MRSATKYSPPENIMVFFTPDELRAIADRWEKEMPNARAGDRLPDEMIYGDGFTVQMILDQQWWHDKLRRKLA